jgi:hypothetical protein
MSKAVTFKLHEPLHNLDGAKCGDQIAPLVGKIVQLSRFLAKAFLKTGDDHQRGPNLR